MNHTEFPKASSSPEKVKTKAEWAEQATDAFRSIIPNAQGSLDTYMTGGYPDAQGRDVDVRLMQSKEDPSSFRLNANYGDPLALIPIREALKKHGIRVDRMVGFDASPDVQRTLDDACKT